MLNRHVTLCRYWTGAGMRSWLFGVGNRRWALGVNYSRHGRFAWRDGLNLSRLTRGRVTLGRLYHCDCCDSFYEAGEPCDCAYGLCLRHAHIAA